MVLKRESGLTPRDVEHFVRVLEDRRRQKVDAIERLIREATPEPLEDETEVRAEPARDVERAEYAELARINEALSRIIEGTYGICQECGRAIGQDRLELLPTTPLCVECQERAEAA